MLCLPGIIDQQIITDTTPVILATYPEGLLHYYGTLRNTQSWQNPTNLGLSEIGSLTAVPSYTATAMEDESGYISDRQNQERTTLFAEWAASKGSLLLGFNLAVNVSFPEPVKLDAYILYPTWLNTDTSNTFRYNLPLSWVFQASNDQVNWITLDTRNVSLSTWQTLSNGGMYVNQSEVKILKFPINSGYFYQYYRFINITTSSTPVAWAMSDMEFLGEPANSVNLNTLVTRRQNLHSFFQSRAGTNSYTIFYNTTLNRGWNYVFTAPGTYSIINPNLSSTSSYVPPETIATLNGSAIKMVAGSSSIQLSANSNSLGSTTGNISFWFKRSRTGAEALFSMTDISTGTITLFEIYFTSNNNLTVAWNNRNTTATVATITDTDWHLIVCQIEGNLSTPMSIWLDTEFRVNLVKTTGTSGQRLFWGSNLVEPNYIGELAHFMGSSIAFSPTEQANYYTNFYPFGSPPPLSTNSIVELATLPEGLINYFGTMRGTQAWVNPIERRLITYGNTGAALDIVGTSLDDGSQICDRILKANCFSHTMHKVLGTYTLSATCRPQYAFPELVTISAYVLRPTFNNAQSGSVALPIDWTFEGSNDQTNWNVIDTRKMFPLSTWGASNGQYYQNSSEVKTLRFNTSNTIPYRYYRFNNIVTTNSIGYSYWAMSDVEFIGTASGTADLTAISNRRTNFTNALLGRESNTSAHANWATYAYNRPVQFRDGLAFSLTQTYESTYNMGQIIETQNGVAYRLNGSQTPLHYQGTLNNVPHSTSYLEIWFRRGRINYALEEGVFMLKQGSSPFNIQMELFFNSSNQLRWGYMNRAQNINLATITDFNWHYFVFDLNGTTTTSVISLYLDGALVTTTPRGSVPSTSACDPYLGCTSDYTGTVGLPSSSYYFHGDVAGFQCNSVRMLSTDVESMWNNFKP
jgi:hypothetical protein